MKVKTLELRDRNTFIPVLAVDMNPGSDAAERYLLRRAGYACDGEPIILLVKLDGGKSSYDPYKWGDRTFKTAHLHIEQNWGKLISGDVIDVEFILGETAERKLSEKETAPW